MATIWQKTQSLPSIKHIGIASTLVILALATGLVPTTPARAEGGLGPGTIIFQTVSGGPIYALSADTPAGDRPWRYLTTGIDPALSPDGQWVAFTRWDNDQHSALGSLWVIHIDGGGERLILDELHQPKAPTWSPDGGHIVISIQQGGRLSPEQKCGQELPSEPLLADEDGDYFRVVVEVDSDGELDTKVCYTLLPHPFWGLRMVDVATGDYQDLPHDRFSYAPTWDPANDWRLVYDGDQGLVNLDINRGTTWALTDDVNDHAPVFSPDGSKIAVSYWQHDHWDIHLLDVDTLTGPGGSGRVRLTKTPLRAIVEQGISGQEERAWNNVAPAWSPDGSHIIFLTDRTGRWEIWVMPVPGTQAQVETDGRDQRPLLGEDAWDQLGLEYNGVYERVLSWR